ncbi:hypothetical protein [Dyadobacter bucti]|uniref:hypothetical protein n=1 Tax=Dyadobacter bucti TaxID=2572203 RepID=UPI003F6FC2C2
MFDISKTKLFVVACCFFALASLTYIHRYPTGDDAWFAEQSFWLQKEGIIRSEFFRGLLGWENQILVSHKLFLLVGAVFIQLFGYQLPALQFVGLVFFYTIVCELIIYIRKREGEIYSWYLPAMLILVFANRLLVKMSFENRPEMMLAALGFGSFLLIDHDRKSTWKVLLAAVLAGLAFLTHLNGVIYLIAGLVTLICSRNYRSTLVFMIAGGFTCLAYFIDIIQADNGLLAWYQQFRGDPATQNAFGLSSKLLQLVTYPRLFFHSPEQIAVSLLLVFLLWNQRAYIKLLPVRLRVYSLTLLLSFWLITKANGALYLVLFIPFMLVLAYELYRLAPFRSWALKLVIAAYFVIGVVGMCQIIYTNATMEYLPVSYEKLRKDIPDHKSGFVPLTFFFNEYEQYPRLLTHENYKLQSNKKGMTTVKMAKWAYKNGAGFIVMDYKFRPEPYYPKAGTKKIPFYNLSFFNGRFAIYQR